MYDLEGKVAVVTGGASGIGLAMAERFATEGMRVVIADVEAGALDDAAADLRERDVHVHTAIVDVSNHDEVVTFADDVADEFGGPHLVCNNAGVSFGGFTQSFSEKDWDWVLGVNLWGVIHGVKAFLPKLLAQGEGHFVNTGSVLGLYAAPFTGPYAVSKFGVVALSEVLFHELAMSGTDVGVSVLCPGWVSTNLHSADRNRPGHLRNEHDEAAAAMGETMRSAMRGVMEAGMAPADVAGLVVDAVRAKQFYILTHDETAEAVRARAEAMINRTDPPFAMPQ